MKKRWLGSLFLGSALLLGACGGGDDEATTTTDDRSGDTASFDAEKITNQKCIACHGENLQGQGNFPKLADVGSRLSEDEIYTVITEGRGGMPAGIIKGDEAKAVAAWLAEKK